MKTTGMIMALAGATVLMGATQASAALLYKNPGDTSAYVGDWAVGATYTNYAFNAITDAFVGSWEVDQGPNWHTVPVAYSGVEAAAHLFGGTAADYVISTLDANPADINREAWVSTWGGACGGTFPCGTQVADTFVVGTQVAGGVPEPTVWAILMVGMAGLGATLRLRRLRTIAA